MYEHLMLDTVVKKTSGNEGEEEPERYYDPDFDKSWDADEDAQLDDTQVDREHLPTPLPNEAPEGESDPIKVNAKSDINLEQWEEV